MIFFFIFLWDWKLLKKFYHVPDTIYILKLGDTQVHSTYMQLCVELYIIY